MVDASIIKTVIELYSNLIEKPKMNEKFLNKPPPKFLFDVIISTMKVTNFPNGLYSNKELDSEWFNSDKQNRIEFLNKAIDITKIVNKTQLDVKVKNMLAGEEPSQTNTFLIAFHKAATSKQDFSKYISKYLDSLKKKEEDKKVIPPPSTLVEKEKEKEVEKPKEKEKPKESSKEAVKVETKKEVEKKNQSSSAVDPVLPKKSEKNIQKVNPTQPAPANNKDEDEENELGVESNLKITMGKVKLGEKGKGKGVEAAKKPSMNLKDLESIKSFIHEICTNANPISKLIDNIPEDIDQMNKELLNWKSESEKYSEQYEEEQKASEEVIFPLEKEYLELEEMIRDEQMRIIAIKQRILTNEKIIQNLINGVISIKQK